MREKFSHAFRGLRDGLDDHSVRFQMLLAVMAVIAGIVLKLDGTEWIQVILCIGMVLSTEMLNTCIEKTCDLISRQEKEEIRLIKDLSAGAVLTASVCALVSAMIILWRRFI